MDLVKLLRRETLRFGSRPAISCTDGRSLSYREVWAAVDERRRELCRAGVGEGRVAALSLDDGIESVLYMFACWAQGVTVAPTPKHAVNSPEILRSIGAHYLIGSPSFYKESDRAELIGSPSTRLLHFALEAGSSEHWEESELWLQSSGTTGTNKTARLGPAGIWFMLNANAEALDISHNDRTLQLLPLTYSYGLIGQFLTHFLRGALTVMPHSRTSALFSISHLARAYGITTLMLIPQFTRWWEASNRVRNSANEIGARLITVGGDLLDTWSFDFLRSVAPNASVAVTYGLVEAGPRVCTGYVDGESLARGSVGVPLPGVELAVSATQGACGCGGLFVRSPALMRGYVGPKVDDPLSSRPGWLATGDWATLRQGVLFVHGRERRRIDIDGVRIQLEDIERFAYALGYFVNLSVDADIDSSKVMIYGTPMPGVSPEIERIRQEISERFAVRLSGLSLHCSRVNEGAVHRPSARVPRAMNSGIDASVGVDLREY